MNQIGVKIADAYPPNVAGRSQLRFKNQYIRTVRGLEFDRAGDLAQGKCS
jgi:hypothetical protein